jgi:aldehyde:ferredoxin oxidoreductase
LGKQTIKLEREFNKRAGFTAKDDRLPEWMTKEPIPETGHVFDVSDEVIDTMYEGIE